MALALALPRDGQLVCCDISSKVTAVARGHAERAGVADKIDFCVGPALDTLDALIQSGAANSFDFVLVDADKPGYDGYYERGLSLLRSGGLIAIDNVLWSGTVADPTDTDPSTETLRALNDKIVADERVDVSMLPLGDGLTLAQEALGYLAGKLPESRAWPGIEARHVNGVKEFTLGHMRMRHGFEQIAIIAPERNCRRRL